jgi:hypothetical protein
MPRRVAPLFVRHIHVAAPARTLSVWAETEIPATLPKGRDGLLAPRASQPSRFAIAPALPPALFVPVITVPS